MPNLFYVDDSTLMVHTLREVLKPLSDTWRLVAIAEPRAPARFMTLMTESRHDTADRFLLDVFMPAPRALRMLDVWPAGYTGDDQFCGLALARWLMTAHEIEHSRIGLLSHVDAERDHHQMLARMFEHKPPSYFRKAHLGRVHEWLQGKKGG